MWRRADIRFVLIDDLSADPVVTAEIGTPAGMLLVMCEPRLEGRILVAERAHMHGVDLGANDLGPARLRVIADAVLAEMDCDELIVEGAVRTTGANPGARPRPVRFARRGRTPSGR